MENATSTFKPINDQSDSLQGLVRYLAQEYDKWHEVYDAQPEIVQRFIDGQARGLGEALLQPHTQARFRLPDRVVVNPANTPGSEITIPVPEEFSEQLVGGLMERLSRTGLSVSLRQQLDELEASPDIAVSTSAGLLRFATAIQMVHHLLPAGRSVVYIAPEGEEIPTIPVGDEGDVPSAITASTDAIAEDLPETQEGERGELLVPYVPAARRFYLPGWVAFDDQDRLLVSSVNEAESYLASMQRFLQILHAAVSLAPYMVADEQYQRKRYGMLGQMINQGRALARYETGEIIATIQHRSAASDLNRGLSLSVPYFDDQDLQLRFHDFDVIPAGRIMFIPAFVVLAARREQAKVDQDTRLSRSTRVHLLGELQKLETAFSSPGD
jgi:hypothetical protein